MSTVPTHDTRRQPSEKPVSTDRGWNAIHSWIFLVIVALAVVAMVVQNRYEYLRADDTGTIYRVDKFFGSLQELSPTSGWVAARPVPLAERIPHAAEPVREPASPAVAETVPLPAPAEPRAAAPEPAQPLTEEPKKSALATNEPPSLAEAAAREPVGDESPVPDGAVIPQPGNQMESQPAREAEPAPPAPAMTKEQRFKVFKERFPDYGRDEFSLADEDLYPDWKKRVGEDVPWPEFLTVYDEFITWWVEAGRPAEEGMKLWNDFLEFRTGR